MISAITLVRVPAEKNVKVLEKLKKLPMIREVTLVYGEYDIIVRTATESIGELNKFVYDILRKIHHITMTTTLIVAHIPEK